MMNKNNCDIFLFAGEDSGDLQGEMILKGLLETNPNLDISGVLGPRMRVFPITEIFPMENFRVMGFIDVLKSLRKLRKHFFFIKSQILKLNPKILVLIDYPGFNMRLAKSLRKSGFKGQILQHVCPSVWAWKKGRIKTLERYFNKLICLFPFEKGCFRQSSLETIYIGHPLVNRIKSHLYKDPLFSKQVIAIFPGSRSKEIYNNLPLQLKTAATFVKNSYDIVVSCIHPKYESFIKKQINLYPEVNAHIVSSKDNYDLMRVSKIALATSGTVTLELALHKVPTLVTYFIKPLDFFIARKIFKIDLPHYCIVNYLANKRIFPEFYGPHFKESMLFESFQFMFNNIDEQNLCISRLNVVEKLLYNPTATQDCAQTILSSL